MLKILYPVTPAHVTQPFGAKSSNYITYHRGVDFRTYNVPRREIKAALGGEVIAVETNTTHSWYNFVGGKFVKNSYYGKGSPYGVFVKIRHYHEEKDSVGGSGLICFTMYAHLNQAHVEVGQKIEAGQVIGIGGNTCKSQGEHLHFELRIGKDNVWSAVNAEKYFVSSFREDGVPDWQNVHDGQSAETIWREAKNLGKVSADSRFDDPVSKGELIVFLKRFGSF